MSHYAHFLIAAVATVMHRWATLYSDSKSISGMTTFVHLGGMLLGGGCAIATDRLTLRTLRAELPAVRHRQLVEIHAVHTPVMIGLTLTFASGALMLAADFSNLVASPVFWIKAGLIVLLLANGGIMQRAETQLRRGVGSARHHWDHLRQTSRASLALWFGVVLAGTLLTVFA
jgi:hypothetical protein